MDPLEVKAQEEIALKEQFGNMAKRMAGIGGTLHITDQEGLANVPNIAWQLSQQTKKPVVIVVRAG